MTAKRANTPYGPQNHSCEVENKYNQKTKQRLAASSIQDRYLLKKSPQHSSEASSNPERINALMDPTIKSSNKPSRFPKIDVKLSLRATKQQFFRGATPNLKLKKIHPKNLKLEPFSFPCFQIREKNSCTFVTHEGSRIKNQDRISIEDFEVDGKSYKYYGIFDGHGGHLAATYMANNLHLLLKNGLSEGLDPSAALKQALLSIQEKLKKNPRLAHKSGTCALVCLFHESQYWVANVGDSRMLSVTQDSQIVQVTRDHKPQDEIQRKRIQYYGGQVYRNTRNHLDFSSQELPFRVYPGSLSVSRTIGDINLKKNNPNLVIAQPDIFHHKVEKEKYLLLFSDGLYEKLSNRQIAQHFLSPKVKQKQAITQIYKQALKRLSTDNRSLIVLQNK